MINNCIIWKNKAIVNSKKFYDGEIVCGDSLDFLKKIKSNCADVIFIDPPFNLGKQYGISANKSDNIDNIDYVYFIKLILDESKRILAKGGSLYLYHIPSMAITFGEYLKNIMNFRHWIAISMKNSFVRGNKLYPAHYALLYFTKGDPKSFCRPKLPIQKCRHCGGDIRDYGGYKSFVKNGVNISDIWDDLSPVRHKCNKYRSANELPQSLLNRILEISGFPGGLLVDPFAGSGVSLLAARNKNMNYIGCDRELSYYELMIERLSNNEGGII